ncbi:hypothetical protein [Altererythrobacter sp. ZODW24]|uniref:hypothetical protein n=1 Tax=Altererythrobacter sp. ZODW24 TaxID=2185142 RepID=UPI000DF8334D|nr:hypothetical protein [Altererythrobacter sp. ZODW24]
MKAFSIAFLRVAVGLMLVVWGTIRLGAPEVGPGLAEKYYGGIAASQTLQTGWGAFQVLIGVLCVVGLFRKFVQPVQALILVGGALAIWKYLLDPLGLYILTEETRQVLFFPSLSIAAATLVVMAFREEDRFSLDTVIARKKTAT